MNNARRKRIDSLIDGINAVSTGIQTLRDEEEAAYDALPESLQDTERADAMQEAMENLESAVDALGEAVDYLMEAKGG